MRLSLQISVLFYSDSQVGETLKRIIEKANIGTSNNSKAHIVFARDTRFVKTYNIYSFIFLHKCLS